jgi:hypothetical protein
MKQFFDIIPSYPYCNATKSIMAHVIAAIVSFLFATMKETADGSPIAVG